MVYLLLHENYRNYNAFFNLDFNFKSNCNYWIYIIRMHIILAWITSDINEFRN